MIQALLKGHQLILGSASPRRAELLKAMGLDFRIVPFDGIEEIPPHIPQREVSSYLSQMKNRHLRHKIAPEDLLLTADTIVLKGDKIIGKPKNYDDAFETLQMLGTGDCWHEVITGCTLSLDDYCINQVVTSAVRLRKLTDDEIDYYLRTFKPFDKAGSYGIQEWIGHIGIVEIKGTQNNIMGLPTAQVYDALTQLSEHITSVIV